MGMARKLKFRTALMEGAIISTLAVAGFVAWGLIFDPEFYESRLSDPGRLALVWLLLPFLYAFKSTATAWSNAFLAKLAKRR